MLLLHPIKDFTELLKYDYLNKEMYRTCLKVKLKVSDQAILTLFFLKGVSFRAVVYIHIFDYCENALV